MYNLTTCRKVGRVLASSDQIKNKHHCPQTLHAHTGTVYIIWPDPAGAPVPCVISVTNWHHDGITARSTNMYVATHAQLGITTRCVDGITSHYQQNVVLLQHCIRHNTIVCTVYVKHTIVIYCTSVATCCSCFVCFVCTACAQLAAEKHICFMQATFHASSNSSPGSSC